MKRLLVLGAALLCACPAANAQPPVGFRLLSDTVKVTSTACTVTAPTVRCRVRVASDTAFTAFLTPLLTVENGAVLPEFAVNCPAPNAVLTFNVRAWGVNASGVSSATYTSDVQTVTCPDGTALPPGGFRLIIRVVSGGG